LIARRAAQEKKNLKERLMRTPSIVGAALLALFWTAGPAISLAADAGRFYI
jgi:hypothetical protein